VSLVPQAILFNGGVFQPKTLQQRIVDVLNTWYSAPGQPWQPFVLTNPSLDLAVAIGAAHYGWLRHIGGKRIGGGIPRSYYVAVSADAHGEAPHADSEAQEARSASEATTQEKEPVTVVCVVP